MYFHKRPSNVTVCAGAFHDVENVLLSPNSASSTRMSKFPFEASIAISSKFKPANGSSVIVCGLFCGKAQEVGVTQVETFSSSTIKFLFAAYPADTFVFVLLRMPLLLFVSPCKTRFLSCLSPSTWPLIFVTWPLVFAMRGATNWCRPSVCGVSGWIFAAMRGSMFWCNGGTEWLRLDCTAAVEPLVNWLQSASSSRSEGKWSRKFCWVFCSGVDIVAVVCWKRQSDDALLLKNNNMLHMRNKNYAFLTITLVISNSLAQFPHTFS